MLKRSVFCLATVCILAQALLFDAKTNTALACLEESYLPPPVCVTNGYILLLYVVLTFLWLYSLATASRSS